MTVTPTPATAVAASGLTSSQAARRLEQYGPNEPVHVRRLSAVAQFLHLFANPLVAILLVASLISASLGQSLDAAIIFTIVVLGWMRGARGRLRSVMTVTILVPPKVRHSSCAAQPRRSRRVSCWCSLA